MFVDSCRRKGQLRQELNVRPDCFDTGKHFTPDGVRTHLSPLLQTFNHYVVATQTVVAAQTKSMLRPGGYLPDRDGSPVEDVKRMI